MEPIPNRPTLVLELRCRSMIGDLLDHGLSWRPVSLPSCLAIDSKKSNDRQCRGGVEGAWWGCGGGVVIGCGGGVDGVCGDGRGRRVCSVYGVSVHCNTIQCTRGRHV